MNESTEIREKRKFTILVLKPDYIADAFGHDTHLAHVEAFNLKLAQDMARVQACHADCQDESEREDANPEDYHILAVFEGHHADLKVED